MKHELYHWGIKGMRWGVRRYQNKDGTLTESGKKRITETVAAKHRMFADRQGFKQKESTKHRDSLPKDGTGYAKTLEKEREKLLKDRDSLKRAGYVFKKNPNSTERERNDDLVDHLLKQRQGVKEAKKKYAEWFLETRAKATLDDLSLKNSESAMAFVKERLIEDVFMLSNYLNGE